MSDRRKFIRQISGTMIGVAGSKLCGMKISAKTSLLHYKDDPSKRIFVAGFAHETNTFHPVPTSSWNLSEVEGFRLNSWGNADLTTAPGVSASPGGGGLLLEKPCREAMDHILASLRISMPVDAIFLQLHGAMYAEGIGHAETVLVREIRNQIGPKIPIACTFDLHGNIPPMIGQNGDILVGLKTAPHTDREETGELAGRILLETIQGKTNPVSFVLPIPMIIQGEKAMTTSDPFRSLVEEARRIEKEGMPGYKQRILAATLFVGCAWTDAPHTGMSVMITSDGSIEAAKVAASYLAGKIWDARYQFMYGCETAELEEGISRALNATERTVFLTDSGDNVTASTPGDLPLVLRQLIERKVENAVVACINDSAALKKCFETGEGNKVHLSVGATIEKRYGPPLETEAMIIKLIGQSGMAVIKTGGIITILTERASTFTTLAQFEQCGINPLERKLIVLKMGYLYPELSKIAPRHIMLLTPGSGDMRIEKLNYSRIRRPIFPLDSGTKFDPLKI